MSKYCLIALFLSATPVFADVRLPKILNSHMVLQRNSEVKIWGWADAGETIQITADWLNATAGSTADADGQWQVCIKTGEAGGPHGMTIAGKNRIELEDILFGEVWIASGQSNMEMPLIKVSDVYTGIQDAATEVANANYPRIRLFQAGNFSSKQPLDDVETGNSMYGIPPSDCQWHACSPETIPTFASTAYFFSRELHTELNVPVGIIDSSWGGTSAETWTPASGLEALGFTAELEQAAQPPQHVDQNIPTRLYNGMIHPLRNFRIRGVVWYQGEGNVGRAHQYLELFSTMIGQWRQAFGYEFPFYFVQIAPVNYQPPNFAYLREAQLQTMSVTKTGMAVTMDIGDLNDIHPRNKQEVGHRLALWALANDYGKEVAYSGPIYKASVIDAGQMRLEFDHVGGGLATRDGMAPSHFEIAGDNQVFHPATAVIVGQDVIVSSEQVAAPKAVRFAFTSAAEPNLINEGGLPASPFRTDRW